MQYITVSILAVIAAIATITLIFVDFRAPQDPPGVELVMGPRGLECVRYGQSNLSCANMAMATDKRGT